LKNKTDLSKARFASDRENAASSIRISDIAREAGVSVSAVSSFLSGKDYSGRDKPGIRIRQATADRIREVCLHLNYVPERPAGVNKIYPELGDIMFLMHQRTHSYRDHTVYSLLINGILSGIREKRLLLSLSHYDPDIDYEKYPQQIPLNILNGDITKVIIGGGQPNIHLLNALVKHECSVVYVMRNPSVPGVFSVVPDNFNAARLAVRHLYEKGHRRLGFAAFSYCRNSYIGFERRRGLVAGLQELGLAWRERDLLFVESDSPAAPGKALTRFLARKEPPTAVFCFHDRLAEYLMIAARKRKLRVPEDLSLIGCNDDSFASDLSPPLTTIHIPAFELGFHACRELNRIAAKGFDARKDSLTLPVRLIKRQSTQALT
jgi:DNA-binding LacI/PurR family transcriptional regulator